MYRSLMSHAHQQSIHARLRAQLRTITQPLASIGVIEVCMRELISAGVAAPPLPGSGRTLERWQALAIVGAADLSLAKIYEGHTDALAIVAELDGVTEGLSAVWAAEGPESRVELVQDNGGWTLIGRKGWCSGADIVDEALVTAWTEQKPMLARVRMREDGIRIDPTTWRAVGMSASASASVTFNRTPATVIGAPGTYLSRPGFWQGGAGIAAVWYGATVAVGREVAISRRAGSDPHVRAHLGTIDAALASARASLKEAAVWIDAHPTENAERIALEVRALVECAATTVLSSAGRALGAAPLCLNPSHAQRCADLAVFLRQSHAEADLASLGAMAALSHAQWDL